MTDIHKDVFYFSGAAYYDGWDRIFGKKVKNGEVDAPRRRRKVQKASSQSRQQGPGRVDRSQEIRKEEDGKDGGGGPSKEA